MDSVRDWRTKWFYSKNMNPALPVYSVFGPIPNDWWEKNPLSSDELIRIRPLQDRIRHLKQLSLTGLGIVASYLHY